MKRIYMFTMENNNLDPDYKNKLRLLVYMLYDSIYNYYGEDKIPLNLNESITYNKINENVESGNYQFDSEICGDDTNYYYEPFLMGENSFGFTIVDDSFDINIIRQLLNQNLNLLKIENKINIKVVTYYSVDEKDESNRNDAILTILENLGIKQKKSNWFDFLFDPLKKNKRR